MAGKGVGNSEVRWVRGTAGGMVSPSPAKIRSAHAPRSVGHVTEGEFVVSGCLLAQQFVELAPIVLLAYAFVVLDDQLSLVKHLSLFPIRFDKLPLASNGCFEPWRQNIRV